MTPVESTRTSSVFRSSSRAASALVARASSLPRSPVAEFATPELMTTACGSACPMWSRFTVRQAAWTLLRLNIAAPTAGAVERKTARSFAVGRIPAWIPEAMKPRGAVTLTRESSRLWR